MGSIGEEKKALVKMTYIVNGLEEVLQVMESEGIFRKIVEKRHVQEAAATGIKKDKKKARKETFAPRASKDREKGAENTSGGTA